MDKVAHSVRWRTQDGFKGWGYTRTSNGIWGFSDVGGGEFDVRVAPKSNVSVRTGGKTMVSDRTEAAYVFVAPDGTSHESMRALFAAFRLRMCESDPTTALEHLRLVLQAIDEGPWRTWDALADEAFEGSAAFARAYVHWLDVEGLVARMGPCAHHLAPSVEGAAVLQMLDLTAPGSTADPSAASVFARLVKRSRLTDR